MKFGKIQGRKKKAEEEDCFVRPKTWPWKVVHSVLQLVKSNHERRSHA